VHSIVCHFSSFVNGLSYHRLTIDLLHEICPAADILRNNTFRRVRQEDKTFLGYPSVQAIYLDDQMSGWLIEGNTVIDAQMGIMVGGGRDTIVKVRTVTLIHLFLTSQGFQLQ